MKIIVPLAVIVAVITHFKTKAEPTDRFQAPPAVVSFKS